MKKNSVYGQITDRITALLEQGTIPWHKPWKARTGLPRNFVSQKPYRGINVFLLIAMSYESPLWLTFRQASKLGGSVRKGEKACPVVFWKKLKVEDKASGETDSIPLLRYYHVFNASQCEGLDLASINTATASNGCSKPEEIVDSMPSPPLLKHGMTLAYYSPHEDCVGLPARERFTTEEGYYATLFHELVHSTGHEKRLNRSTLAQSAGYGSDPYCKEELIAEMGAAFLCGHAELTERTIVNSAAYIGNWLKRLENDKALIVQAAAQAQRAADFVLGRTLQESEADNDPTPSEIDIKITRDFDSFQSVDEN